MARPDLLQRLLPVPIEVLVMMSKRLWKIFKLCLQHIWNIKEVVRVLMNRQVDTSIVFVMLLYLLAGDNGIDLFDIERYFSKGIRYLLSILSIQIASSLANIDKS